jgi:sulfur carrier protein ThiS
MNCPYCDGYTILFSFHAKFRKQTSMGTIAVDIKLKGYLSRTGSESRLVLDVETGTCLTEVIGMVARQDDRLAKIILDSKGLPDKGVAIFLDRTLIPYGQLGQRKLTAFCEITLVPTVAGG